jgi:ribosome-associated translation inhibitor RaiA
MRFDIRAAAGLPPAIVALAETRLASALDRFSPRIHRLSVRLSDLNGPRGGVDKKCLVTVQLRAPRLTIVLEDTAEDAAVAIARIADKIGHVVARAISAGRGRAPLLAT